MGIAEVVVKVIYKKHPTLPALDAGG